MLALLRLFVDIALLRRGPDSAPGTPTMLVTTIALYAVAAALLVAVLQITQRNWQAQVAVGLAFTLAWYWVLLRFGGKPERYLQTAVAVVGYQLVLMPLNLGLQAWLGDGARDAPPALVPQILFVLVLAWSLAVNTRIVRAALEWPAMIAGAVVLAEFFTSLVLLAALFGTGAKQ